MDSIPFIDIHTHRKEISGNTVKVNNLFPGDDIPLFTGKNFFSVGLHPRFIGNKDENNQMMQIMEDALELDHVIFVGECGLDKLAETGFDEQFRVFKAQAFMAEEYQKPLIIHCVRAWNEIIELHKKSNPTVPWIFHGYNGSPELTGQLKDENFLFSFGKALLNPNSKAARSIKILPAEKIFFETDEYEGTVEEIYRRGSELKELNTEDLKRNVWENFNTIENINING